MVEELIAPSWSSSAAIAFSNEEEEPLVSELEDTWPISHAD